MALKLGRYGSREIMDFQIFDFSTKKELMTIDYATSAQTENTAETVYARGGSGNPRRIAWNGDKETTVTVETQIFTMQHLAMLAGENIVTGASEIYKREVLPVENGGIVTLSKTPIENEVAVYSFVNGILTDSLEVASVNGNEVKIATTPTVPEVEVYYRYEVSTAHKLSFTAKGFPPYVFLVGDTTYADEVSGGIAMAQLKYYKAKLQPNFTVTNAPSGDPSSLTLTFDIFPVKINGVDTLYDMTIYDDN
ncbi:hypothetical protein QJQ58_15655 [Paenibacillus dendritiformis]|uniref:hypothetical protein n=1 Tax=Paenibacillus dendritiformis TaxID=130049 RepID=UPI00248B8504|nr:hypothetical protein [Paenibacillus dendritiformis]WGU92047.1 hypothetical protein QJQ58_15655 [Paenibacillus dendritiformis]